MFIITLEFADTPDMAGPLIERHNEWIGRGFDDGVFALVGGLKPTGGGILATGTTLLELERRVEEDPLVAEGVVKAQITELSPWRTDDRLTFLMDE